VRPHRKSRPPSRHPRGWLAVTTFLDLAPGGVYRAARITPGAGGLLHHRFTLTSGRGPGAVCFLWHFPAGHPGSVLPTTLPCGARTFLTRRNPPGAAARPSSVHPLKRADGHPSGTAIADSLLRSTREHRAGRPQSLARITTVKPQFFLTLLRVGFTKPPQSPAALVVSYTTVSPLPFAHPRVRKWRSVFCGTVPRVTPGRCYRPPCRVEPGPSSPGPKARRDRPAFLLLVDCYILIKMT